MSEDLDQMQQEVRDDPGAPEDIADTIFEAAGIRLLLDKFGSSALHAKDSNGNTLAHLTARWCQDTEPLELISEALTNDGATVSEYFQTLGNEGGTAMHFAAKNSNISALEWLINLLEPEQLTVTDELHNTPFHYSALFQSPQALELFKEKVEISIFNEANCRSRTVFHCAAQNESGENLRWLINELGGGENLTAQDDSGNTPAHLAAWCLDVETMQVLKEELGDSIFELQGEDGETVAHSAAANTQSNLVLEWCINEMDSECLLNAKDSKDRTVMHRAAENQSAESLQLLFDALGQSCLEAKDHQGRTVLHYAAMNSNSDSALRWLISQLGTESLCCEKDNEGVAPVHLMGRHLSTDALDYLSSLEEQQLFRVMDNKNRTIVHHCAENDQCREMLAWCVRNLEDLMWLQEEDATGVTPLCIASGRKEESE